MKTTKIILSFLLVFVMIVGIMPTVFASEITITGLNLPVNMTKSANFYVNIPDGFGKATVEIDNTYVRTITEDGGSFYRVKLDPKDYLTPGTHEVKISAGDIVETKEVEFYYPASNENVITADMSGLAELTTDDSLTATQAANATGLTSVVSQETATGVTISRKSGLGTKEATDYSLAFVGKTGNTANTASYIQQNFSSSVNSGIVEIEFSFYREGNTLRHLWISAPRPTTSAYGYGTIQLNSAVNQAKWWYHVRILLNLSERTYGYEVDNGGGVIASGNGQLENDDMTMTRARIQMSPANDDSAFVAIDDLKIDTYVPMAKEVEIMLPADGEEIISNSSLDVQVSAANADSMTLYVDGEETETKQNDGSDNYTFSINADDVAYGLKDIRAVAFSGGTPIGADSLNINWKGIADSDLTTVESAAYTQDAEATSAANTIPASAESVSLSLSKALNVTDDDVELYIDGVLAAHNGVSVSDKVVTVNLPALSASSDVKVVLKNTNDGLSAALSAFFNVTDETGFYAKVVNYNISSDAAGAVVHFIAPDDVAVNTFVASYNEGLMTEVSANSLMIGKGKQFTAITKSELSDFDRVKILLWDTNMKPLVSAVSN